MSLNTRSAPIVQTQRTKAVSRYRSLSTSAIQSLKRAYLLGFIALIFLPLHSHAAPAESILPQSLVVSLQIAEVFEYRCPSNTQCQIRCASDVSETISYQNVRRAELAKSEGYWIIGAIHIDSLGKGHRASGFVPEPASCFFDDLEYIGQVPIVDGAFSREPDEVIFELSPSN